MNARQQKLWKKIQDFCLDDAGSDFKFSDRLARENKWDKEFTQRVIQEYKKFMFLICLSEKPLTPSDQVDQAWHLHLVYTKSYWHEFCKKVLERDIHHGPTKGGDAEKEKYHEAYERTKEFYHQTFKEKPPTDIWPSSEERFNLGPPKISLQRRIINIIFGLAILTIIVLALAKAPHISGAIIIAVLIFAGIDPHKRYGRGGDATGMGCASCDSDGGDGGDGCSGCGGCGGD